jgi:Putative DNA-binding domain
MRPPIAKDFFRANAKMDSMASLLDRNPHDIEPDELRAFLEERQPESERLDYKRDLNRSIADTLVAMANTDGGIVIVGVEEQNQLPVAWAGLSGKDWLDTLGNHNSLECVAPVRYEAVTVQLPENTGKPILVVRVPPSLRKPHMTHAHGILVRVGSQDRPPSLEQIEAWYRARSAPASTSRFRGSIPYFLMPAQQTGDQALYISVLASPVHETVPLPMSEATDFKIELLLRSKAPGTWVPKSKGITHIEFRTSNDDGVAYVDANGYAVVRGRFTSKDVQILPMLETLAITLCFDLRLFRDVFAYADDIIVRIAAANLELHEFVWMSSMYRLDHLAPSGSGDDFQTTLAHASDIEGIVRETATRLCRQAQLNGYTAQVEGAIGWLKESTPAFKCD